MEGEIGFRDTGGTSEPTESRETPSVISDRVTNSSELPPSLYVESHKPPLFLELIGGVSAYHHFDMESITNEINSYIIEDLHRKNLSDTHADYETVLNDALRTLKFPDGTDVYAMVEKLVRHYRIQHKLFTALKEKEDLMQADPLTLSAAKFKIYLEKGYGR